MATSTKTIKAPAKRAAPAKAPATKAPASKALARAVPAPATKPLVKPAAKPAAAPKATAPKPVAAPAVPKAAKPAKVKKPKQVRDSYTMPKSEYNAIADLKLRAAKLASPVKKSELLRAGIMALTAMGDTAFLAAVKAVPTIKTGRPPAAD